MRYEHAEDHPVPLDEPMRIPGCPGCTQTRVKAGDCDWKYVVRVSLDCLEHRRRIGRRDLERTEWVEL